MTLTQAAAVTQLKAEGFEIQSLTGIVQLKRGADIRVVRQDGSVVRGSKSLKGETK